MDTITLVRKVKDEYIPRVYQMSGATFEELIGAVKALEQRKYESKFSFNHWVVNGEGIKLLQEQGYTINQESDLFVHQRERTLYTEELNAQPYHIEISINTRQPSGEPPAVTVSGLSSTILLYLTDDYIELRKAEIDGVRREIGFNYDATTKDVIEVAKRAAVRRYYEMLQVIFEQHFKQESNRTLDDLKTAITAIKAVVVKNVVYKPDEFAKFFGVVIDGEDTIVQEDHEEAQRIIQAVHNANEAAAAARAAAKEAENATMIANAPQKISEWFARLTKAEIASALQEKIQYELDAKQLKQTKKLLIESITGDRELCEKLVRAVFIH